MKKVTQDNNRPMLKVLADMEAALPGSTQQPAPAE